MKALGAVLWVRCQSRGALKQPRLRIDATTPARPVRDPDELRRDLLVMADGSESAMPHSAITVRLGQRIGERRVDGSPLACRSAGMHRGAHQRVTEKQPLALDDDQPCGFGVVRSDHAGLEPRIEPRLFDGAEFHPNNVRA